MTFKMIFLATLAILMAVSYPLEGVPAERQPVTPVKEWSGSIDDPTIVSAAPEIILSAKEFEALWLAWKLPGPLPEVELCWKITATSWCWAWPPGISTLDSAM